MSSQRTFEGKVSQDSMTWKPGWQAQVDEEGRLVLPPEMIARYGLGPGAQVRLEAEADGLRVRQPVTHLAKVYVEPTNACNLDCCTCIRNVWDESIGWMDDSTFARIIVGLRAFTPPPTVFLGGFGEPLAHPDIVEMVAQSKSLGAPVELITNGMLLTLSLSRRLIAAGLDVLWVSLDGATPDSYSDVRLGAALPQVLANVAAFRDARPLAHPHKPEIGIAFVAMKRNITDLPEVLSLGSRLGAARFVVSNVLPYTAEMSKEVLYERSLLSIAYQREPWAQHVKLPRLDIDEHTCQPLYRVMRGGRHVSFAGANMYEASDHCAFIAGGSTAIRWDGSLSPCLPLLHNHSSYLDGRERVSRRYIVGNVAEYDLHVLWRRPEYVAFRERVQAFDFAPCTCCGGCNFSEANEEDCFGNTFPTCGGCLWAQGIIQCP